MKHIARIRGAAPVDPCGQAGAEETPGSEGRPVKHIARIRGCGAGAPMRSGRRRAAGVGASSGEAHRPHHARLVSAKSTADTCEVIDRQ